MTGSSLVILVGLSFISTELRAEDDSDILDRRDVQSILFGQSYYDSRNTVFRAEFVGDKSALSVGTYYINRMTSYLKTLWGLNYRNTTAHEDLLNIDGQLIFAWERFFIQPFTGVDAGWSVYPHHARNLYSHAILGVDFQLANNFGISTREKWSFPNSVFPLKQPLEFKMENSSFELVLFWQI